MGKIKSKIKRRHQKKFRLKNADLALRFQQILCLLLHLGLVLGNLLLILELFDL